MRSILRALAVCAAIGASCAPRFAQADNPPVPDPWQTSGPTDHDKATAADLRARADKAFNAGDLHAALAHNLAAYRLLGDRATACNTGLLARKIAASSPPEKQAEHYELAADLLEQCTSKYRLAPASGEEERRRVIGYHRELELARAELGAVRVLAPAQGAEVRIGGRVLGHGPLDVTAYVGEGLHEVSATRGTETTRRVVQVQKRGAYNVRLELAPPSEREAKPETAPAPSPPLLPRRFEAPPPPPSPRDPVVIAGTAASGGAAVAAAVLFGLSSVSYADARRARKEADALTGLDCFQSYRAPLACRAYRQETGNAHTFATAGYASLGGAALSGAATLVYVLARPRSPKSTLIAPKNIGMVLQWR